MSLDRSRETKETTMRVELELAGPGEVAIQTTSPFLTTCSTTLARYAGFGLRLDARGDLRHHLIEDVAIALGAALRGGRGRPAARATATGSSRWTTRWWSARSTSAGGRTTGGRLPSSLYEHWMRSFADHARATLHLRVLRGRDRHHIVEAAFKALGGGASARPAQPADRVQSTKGEVRVSR